MAKRKKREKAINLRKKGKSYSQIKDALKISKSTLSYWLKDYPLSEKRLRSLRDNNIVRIEKCRQTKRKKKEDRLAKFYKKQKKTIFPITKKQLFIAGLFLYWGEGTKRAEARTAISNSDPSVIKFFVFWLEECFCVPRKKLKVYLHLYKDMDINKEIVYWSRILSVPKSQFAKPYIKKTSINRINHKGSFNHGTCNIILDNARLSENVKMGIKVISDYYLNMRP